MIRPYHQNDYDQLIKLLRLNTPDFFDPSEEAEFISYLKTHPQTHFVVEENEEVIAGGGFEYESNESRIARIAWDFVHPHWHRKGIGMELAQFRINEIKKHGGIKYVIVRTSQLAFGFYEKLGFHLTNIEMDYWAEGYDLYEMTFEV